MNIQEKNKPVSMLHNLLGRGYDFKQFRGLVETHKERATTDKKLRERAREAITEEFTTLAAAMLAQLEQQASDEAKAIEAKAATKAIETDKRRDAYKAIMPIMRRGAFDDFVKQAEIGELVCFNVDTLGKAKIWASNNEWREASKRFSVGVKPAQGILIASVPIEAADAFAKKYDLPSGLLSWDSGGMRSYVMSVPYSTDSVSGLKCRLSTASTTFGAGVAPVDGFKFITGPSKCKLADDGRPQAAPASLLGVVNVAAHADARDVDKAVLG